VRNAEATVVSPARSCAPMRSTQGTAARSRSGPTA
jgi:hypothetical protein